VGPWMSLRLRLVSRAYSEGGLAVGAPVILMRPNVPRISFGTMLPNYRQLELYGL
jgi:hypothetical protein